MAQPEALQEALALDHHTQAIEKAARMLGFWLDTDGQMYTVEPNGSLCRTVSLPSGPHLRRAQSYIVHLLENGGAA